MALKNSNDFKNDMKIILFKQELKELLKKYNAEIYAHTLYEDSNEVEITIDIEGKEVFRTIANNGISQYDF